jgi:hypothetical protein
VIKADGIARTLLMVKIGKEAGVDIEKLTDNPPSVFSHIVSQWMTGQMESEALKACLCQIADINPHYKLNAESSEMMRTFQ